MLQALQELTRLSLNWTSVLSLKLVLPSRLAQMTTAIHFAS